MTHNFPRDFGHIYPTVAKAKGIYIWDTKGKRYIDSAGGAVVVGIGHGVARVAQAVAAQMKKVSFAHTSQFVSLPAVELARELIRFAGKAFLKGRVYFCSGGSEAIETAMKLARAYHLETGQRSRQVVLSRTHSYHGSTLGCLNVSGHPARRGPYEVMLDASGIFTGKIPAAYCYRCPWDLEPKTCNVPCADELERKILEAGSERVSTFIAEPISGASLAAAVPSDKYWPRIREICDRHGVLLIADEVMTGFGRTGDNFGLDRWHVAADLVVLGKGIASGYLPLSGVLVRERVWKPIAEGSGRFEHGFTYHGHPVACAAGVAVLKYLNSRKLVPSAEKQSSELRKGLLKLKGRFPIIGDVRGAGMLWGLEFVRNRTTKEPFPKSAALASRVREAAFRRGLIVYPGSGFIDGEVGDHIMLAPPLIVTKKQINEILRLLSDAIDEVSTSFTQRR